MFALMEEIGPNQTMHMFRPVCQVAAPVGRRTMLFGWDCQVACCIGGQSLLSPTACCCHYDLSIILVECTNRFSDDQLSFTDVVIILSLLL